MKTVKTIVQLADAFLRYNGVDLFTALLQKNGIRYSRKVRIKIPVDIINSNGVIISTTNCYQTVTRRG